MKLADSNVWLALTLDGHAHHAKAAAWFASQSGSGTVCFCRMTQMALVRLLTTSAVLAPYGTPPLSSAAAWHVIDLIMADPRIGLEAEPGGLEAHWRRMTDRDTASPKLWMDAYLAAFAMSGGHQLVTFDAAFRHIEGLDVVILA